MKKIAKSLFCTVILLMFAAFFYVPEAQASFRFVSWADTKSGTSALTRLSKQIKALASQPVFTIYPGDLISSGSSLSSFQTWANALNGGTGNGMLDITFATRGNHDSSATTTFTQFFQFGPESDSTSIAHKVGATHYSSLNTDLTYSFDYQNAHFVGIDLPGGGVSSMSSAQITWLDQDLSAAEARGIKHAFLFWHGPIYYVDDHSSTASSALVKVLSKHPIISASFHGHEHVMAHVTLNSSRIPSLTTSFEEFVTGNAGAGGYSCSSGRSDYCQNYYGFATIDVLSDTQFTVSIYKDGVSSPQWQKTFTKQSPGTTNTPTPHYTPTNKPSPTSTPKPSPTPTPRPSPTSTPKPSHTPTPSGKKPGDANGDGMVDIIDFQLLSNSYGLQQGQTRYDARCDFNGDNVVDILDFQILSNNFGK